MPQGLWSAVPGALHRLADCPLADAHGFGGLALGPAFLLEVPGLETSNLFPFVECRVHARQCITYRS
jgi:hypothetical protein